MTRPPLHLARPGQLPAPATGDDTHQILSEAIDSLARQRTAYWLGDSAVRLHALASLLAQAEQLLPQAICEVFLAREAYRSPTSGTIGRTVLQP